MIALDIKTGKEVWRTKSSDPKDGYSMTVAPLVAGGVVIVGVAGAEFGHRGYLEGLDPQTGKQLWRTYTIPAKGEPGWETWAGDSALTGGGSTWITGSYDPELDLVFWGTGNPGAVEPARPQGRQPPRQLDPGDPAQDRARSSWSYQKSPGDPFDYDGVNELVHADLTIDGTPRKVIMQADRNGFLYVLERSTGKLLAANKYVKVNWAERIDLATGRPVWTDVTKRRARRQEGAGLAGRWSAARTGTRWRTVPQSKLIYVNTMAFGWDYNWCRCRRCRTSSRASRPTA